MPPRFAFGGLARATLARTDAVLARAAASGRRALHRAADAAVIRLRPGARTAGGGDPAVRARAARGNRALLRLGLPRHAPAGAALPHLLRPAERRHRARCLP